MNKNGFAYQRQIPIDLAYDMVIAGAGPATMQALHDFSPSYHDF